MWNDKQLPIDDFDMNICLELKKSAENQEAIVLREIEAKDAVIAQKNAELLQFRSKEHQISAANQAT